MADIAPFLQSVKLPVMPEVAHALIRTLNDEDADVTSVRNVIAKDPALTATLLRIANSALFGLSRSVNSLDSAMSVVGMSQVRARALSICLANAFVMPPPLNRLEFWRHCMVSAGYAKWLAGHVGIDEQQAWLSGMMLRLGQLTIAQKSTVLLEEIEALPSQPGERWRRERDLLGFDEGQITAEIAKRWDFPDALVRGLHASGAPMQAATFSRLGAVLHLAGLMADDPSPAIQDLSALPTPIVQALKLDIEKLSADIPSAESFSDISALLG
ncbi:HDOD domain-containing protein [Rhodoferax saidenbachensis]|uniref:Histidine kinase n=1 Tax=Rhodoferax saidenbachensis TaxID=1484693 RepID=A0A1P8K9N4_9BURK|nr:HDOD domain-containing protein [Rhodoferax saidenbachensis]APW42701.1 histidine kinase [Rhodoferax saidenbachensis]